MRWLPLVLVVVLVAVGARVHVPQAVAADTASPAPGPVVTVPPDYRTWPYASASLALSYPDEEAKLTSAARAHLPPAKVAKNGSAMTANAAGGSPAFQNVFVSPEAYAAFQKTGLYPDKTVFVLEVRASVSRQSSFLAPGGLYQGDVVAIRTEMRDDARYPQSKWAWFDFKQGNGGWQPVLPQPEPAQNCLQCHAKHGAVQDSFTQFYPTLFAIAKAKGTVKPGYAR